VRAEDLTPMEKVLAESDVIFIGAPHKAYRSLKIPGHKVVDVWDCLPKES